MGNNVSGQMPNLLTTHIVNADSTAWHGVSLCKPHTILPLLSAEPGAVRHAVTCLPVETLEMLKQLCIAERHILQAADTKQRLASQNGPGANAHVKHTSM